MAPTQPPTQPAASSPAPTAAPVHHAKPSAPASLGLMADIPAGRQQAAALAAAGLPVFFPHLILAGTQYDGPISGEYPRGYMIGHYPAYRIVLVYNSLLGQYYGVQGTTWRRPPILSHPSEFIEVGHRRFEVVLDGHRMRLIAWRTPTGVYWISNTLSLNISNAQMTAMAASTSTH